MGQDPVFWEVGQTEEGKSVLQNPQAQNSYSYSVNNPIIYKDPDGRVAILAPVLIGGGVGFLGGLDAQALNDFNNKELSGLDAYAVSAGQGTIVGAGTAITGVVAGVYALSSLTTAGTIGFTSASLTAGTQLVGDYWQGKNTNKRDLVANSTIAGLSGGVLSKFPNVRGRLPNIGSSAFFTGTHTRRQAAEELFIGSFQSIDQSIRRYSLSGDSLSSFTTNQLRFIKLQMKKMAKNLKRFKKN